ncbi:MAG: CvpA family protein [Gammaproteobacteria bacterium]|nr:CvpA family protein [Gammaproteobacteria bacterium]
MTVIDSIFLIVFGVSMVVGFMRGFTKEVISIAALVLGLILALALGPTVADLLKAWFGFSGSWVIVPAFVLVLVLVLLAGRLSSFLIQSFIRGLGLGIFERLAGVGFGFLRGMMILSIFSLVVDATPFRNGGWYTNAVSIRMAASVNETLQLNWSGAQIDSTIEGIAGDITDEVTDKVTEELTDQITEEVAGQITDQLTDKVGEEVAGQITDQIKDETATDLNSRVGQTIKDIGDKISQSLEAKPDSSQTPENGAEPETGDAAPKPPPQQQ